MKQSEMVNGMKIGKIDKSACDMCVKAKQHKLPHNKA